MSSSNPSTPQKTPLDKRMNGNGGQQARVRESERARAKREAKECLQVLRHEGFQLDGFNLLGVVANPRAGMLGSSARHSAAPSTRSDDIATRGEGGQEEQAQSSSDMLSDAVYSLGFTLGQVTEQIETVNLFIEELSRQYLGDDTDESHFLEYYYQDDEEQIEEPKVPEQLANLKLAEIESYLERNGDLAHSLFAQGLETSSQPIPTEPIAVDSHAPALSEVQVPDIFFEPGFDLTLSTTFDKLLLLEGKPEPSKGNALDQPTLELLPAREQDDLAGYLDQVELALQEQVRLKAGAFFQETTRFRQLQSSIEELLVQVKTLRDSVQSVLSVYRQTKDISNHQRQDYELLVQLVDAATILLQTKSSIGGLLSANDQVSAADQIQYGRRLLHQAITTSIENDDNDASDSPHKPLELQNLVALSSVNEQFQQYENLVVQSLSEELVDTFFNWQASQGGRVKEIVMALGVCNALTKAGDLYHRRLQQTIRMTVRTTIAEFVESSGGGSSGVTGMNYQDFYSCLELLIEELHSILQTARQVDVFAETGGLFSVGDSRWTTEALGLGADLAAKSVAELLRLRKEAHSLLSLDEMRSLWDTCLTFTLRIEDDYRNKVKAVALRSTLVGQAKGFLDRTHESNMSSLAAALDSERWTPCEVWSERQASLTRLCTGRAIVPSTNRRDDGTNGIVDSQKKATAEVEGVEYKVVWSCLLLVEMVMTNLMAAGHFQSLASNAVTKVAELLRLFNARTTDLVLGAGAIKSAARLKSINAKHLSMVTQCLGMVSALLPHIRAALMAQLPSKQHMLLNDIDKIKKDYTDHSEKVLNKFVTIIGGIVEHGLAPRIAGTDFDARATDAAQNISTEKFACCIFLDGVATNTRKMHQVLNMMLPPDHLQDVFSRIFAYLDNKVPVLLAGAASSTNNGTQSFHFPSTNEGKQCLLLEVESMTERLNGMAGVLPWDFTCVNVLERKMDYVFKRSLPVHDNEEKGTREEVVVDPDAENKVHQVSSDTVDHGVAGELSPGDIAGGNTPETVGDFPQNLNELV